MCALAGEAGTISEEWRCTERTSLEVANPRKPIHIDRRTMGLEINNKKWKLETSRDSLIIDPMSECRIFHLKKSQLLLVNSLSPWGLWMSAHVPRFREVQWLKNMQNITQTYRNILKDKGAWVMRSFFVISFIFCRLFVYQRHENQTNVPEHDLKSMMI